VLRGTGGCTAAWPRVGRRARSELQRLCCSRRTPSPISTRRRRVRAPLDPGRRSTPDDRARSTANAHRQAESSAEHASPGTQQRHQQRSTLKTMNCGRRMVEERRESSGLARVAQHSLAKPDRVAERVALSDTDSGACATVARGKEAHPLPARSDKRRRSASASERDSRAMTMRPTPSARRPFTSTRRPLTRVPFPAQRGSMEDRVRGHQRPCQVPGQDNRPRRRR